MDSEFTIRSVFGTGGSFGLLLTRGKGLPGAAASSRDMNKRLAAAILSNSSGDLSTVGLLQAHGLHKIASEIFPDNYAPTCKRATLAPDGPTRNFHEKYRKKTPAWNPKKIPAKIPKKRTQNWHFRNFGGIFFGIFRVFWG